MTGFGCVLRRIRNECGYSQAVLARMVGCDHSYINRLEHPDGKRMPSRQMVERIAEALRCTEPERQSLLVSAGFVAMPPGAVWDHDLLALNEVLQDRTLPEPYRQSLRDSVTALLRGAEVVRDRPRLAVVRHRQEAAS